MSKTLVIRWTTSSEWHCVLPVNPTDAQISNAMRDGLEAAGIFHGIKVDPESIRFTIEGKE